MMHKLILISLSVLAIAGCRNSDRNYSNESMPAPQMEMADQHQSFSKVASGGAVDTSPRQPRTQNDNPSSQSFMAYRYNYGFTLPAKNVAKTAESHADICIKAGASKCQVLHSSTNASGDDYVTSQLKIRGEPTWLESFKSQIQTSVKEAKGDLTNSSVNAEDLTRQILDTDARLKAKKTLRKRLENHLETRDAKLGDLLAMERELARVQGEIESATSTLLVLKKRVSMSVVDINYQSKSVAVSSEKVSPIVSALKDFVGDISYGLSNVIRFFAVILPWLIFVILPVFWLGRRFWRGRRLRITSQTKDKKADI